MNIQLGNVNIDINDPSDWPNWLRYGLMTLVFLIVFFLGFYFLIMPQLATLQQSKANEPVLKQNLTRLIIEVKNLPAYQQQSALILQHLNDLMPQLTTTAGIPAMMETIFLQGNKSAVHFTSFTPATEVPQPNYVEIPIQLSVSGSYRNIAEFISRLTAQPIIIRIVNFSLSAPGYNPKAPTPTAATPTAPASTTILPASKNNNNNELTLNMLINIYRIPDPVVVNKPLSPSAKNVTGGK